MDSDQGKLFIGGISWETSEEKLNEYFGKYGEVVQTVIMRDKITGRPRGFGFVVFSDPSILDIVLQDKHIIDGRTVEAKRALSRDEQNTAGRSGNPNAGRNSGSGGNIKTKKIFVGGLPATLTEEGFRQYFEAFGDVTDVVVMHDPNTQRPRGFGFISFDTEDAVDRVLIKSFHDLGGKLVEVKRALPRDSNAGGGGGRTNGEGYQGYGSSGANSGSYDSRMETNRYVQPQAAGGGYPYGSAGGYGAGGGYGYGASNNGYGGYGYPGGNAGFSGPAGPYANPSAPNAGGYVSGPPGAPGSSWAATYGANAGYGNTAPWNATGAAGSGPAVSAPTGQSPNGGAGSYGNQGYGYAGNDGSYAANPGTYGAVGGRVGNSPSNNGGGASRDQQGSGYTGNFGGGDANQGYWRTDPSQASNYGSAQQGGQMGYGSGYGGAGYGGAHSRQTQPQ